MFVQTVWPSNTQMDEERSHGILARFSQTRGARVGGNHMAQEITMVDKFGAPCEMYTRALDNDLPRLAAVGVRMIFDMAAELLQIEERLTFKQKLEALDTIGR